MVERCSIYKTRLIEYNWLQSRVRVHKLINNKDRYSNITFQIKRRGQLIVRLKAIESRKDIFCYLSFYLHCSFFWQLVIVTFIYCIIKSSSWWKDLWSYYIDNFFLYCCAIRSFVSHRIIKALSYCSEALKQKRIESVCYQAIHKPLKPLSYCEKVSRMVVRLSLVIVSLSEYSVSVPNLISLEYFVDDGCIHLPSVNFSYRRVDHLSGCRRRALLLHHLKNS